MCFIRYKMLDWWFHRAFLITIQIHKCTLMLKIFFWESKLLLFLVQILSNWEVLFLIFFLYCVCMRKREEERLSHSTHLDFFWGYLVVVCALLPLCGRDGLRSSGLGASTFIHQDILGKGACPQTWLYLSGSIHHRVWGQGLSLS